MALKDLIKRASDEKADRMPERNPLQCVAHGCPLPGSVDNGGAGRFACFCHAWAKPEHWPAITHGIKDHAALREFVQRIRSFATDKTWHSEAVAYVETYGDEELFPRDGEKRFSYQLRAVRTFEQRVGARQQHRARRMALDLGRRQDGAQDNERVH
jgi:hypothetical protein